MTRARRDGLYLLLLGCAVFILLGAVLEHASPAPMVDFRVVYYPARCLMQHSDPYKQSDVLRVYRAEGGDHPSDSEKDRQIVTRYLYLPTAFPLTLPFAMLPWGPAQAIWLTLTVGGLVFASFLVWNLAASYSPVVAGGLIGFLLANSELLIIKGNAAGIVISLCAVAVWCFMRDRFLPAGILCLAVSLIVKPHDAGLVWLYFLLAGGIYRRRALQTLVVTMVLSLPAVLWVWHVAPDWAQELRTNASALAVHGGINDPGLASTGAHGLGMLISLQAVFGVFWDDPHIYNTASYLTCAPLLLLWLLVTLRSRSSAANAWLAIAAVAALTMLPVYHRQYDAKLLLLTVPACAMLWAEGGATARLALLATTAGFVLTGDLSWAILLTSISYLHVSATSLSGELLTAVQIFTAPIILLAMGIFYLWVYVQRNSKPAPHASAADLALNV